ncbi:MAG: FHA domain-containing protein [Roseibium album]|uniref:FHA domain-containing protein n=1 Tax=Roseibium album TaxID=311410 RepID=UPI0032ED277F
MAQPSDIRYFLDVDGDRVSIANHMTVGRHLDNDLLFAGEDVLDYHLRIEMTDRGPRAIPLAEASLRVNGVDLAQPVGLMPGDQLDIGQSHVDVAAELVQPAEARGWRLYAAGGGEVYDLEDPLTVGRSDDSTLRIPDDHISRHHAVLANRHGLIWIQDLGSANGTYVNGERLSGACRLFHGDEIRFDAIAFQLVGRGADLTPVRTPDPAERPLPLAAAPVLTVSNGDTTEFAAVDESPRIELALPEGEAGAFLLGASDPIAGMTFRTPMGRTLIGRQDDCDLVIRDRTVSARHAELMVRAEGVTITNLMATNGTRINGEEIQTGRLHDGDVVRFGRVSLVFKDVPPSEDGRPWLRWLQYALLLASLALAGVLVSHLL